uniref:NADH-ubiquinone oxidoreductase chain 4 n=1 Tax=Derodontidae sp. BMNH 899913 TaxID=1903806 RepID=A0A343A4G5_9COLE|nr:NADH dehydrogenase subunit 4 [Derodontidae sp. BMNH 899913]
MMKFMFMMLFMIPLNFFCSFWMIQFLWFFMFFMFMFNLSLNFFFLNLSNGLGLDLLSFSLICLSFWICSLMILSSQKIYFYKNWDSLFLLVILLLMISLFLTFSSLNMFMFYIFFEASLIPTLMLILGWGYQPERLQAGMYMMFYTLLVSLPMMISLFYFYWVFNSMMFYFMMSQLESLMLYFLINFVFFVKMPMFLVHLWLPKAHVEAPVSGSMILAGVMLKLGGYGMLRFMKVFMTLGLKINLFFISMSLIGGFIISLICLRQSDMKSLIAYSSVSHMSLVISGILTFNYWGFCGSLIMMLGHGLCSSGLFCLSNILYERLMSRSLYLNKGLINLLPSLSLFWFLLVSSNMAAPPSLNLMGEIMLINSIVSFSYLSIIFLMLLSFFSAGYSLFLFSFSQHGKINSTIFSFSMCYLREFLVLFCHWIPLNLMFLIGEYFYLMI